MSGFGPGEVFREYSYQCRFCELDPGSRRPGLHDLRAASLHEHCLEIESLDRATRAELAIEYWGGHIGTAGQQFRVNSSLWQDLPQPAGTPTSPQRYYRTLLGTPPVPIPLHHLRTGRNVFQFVAGPQLAYGFDWGFYWVYAFTVRIYHEPGREHPQGELVSPQSGQTIGERPALTAAARSSHAAISTVDYLGHYEDLDWGGDGRYRKWHHHYRRGRLHGHLGTAFRPPYDVMWDTSWIPDQEGPVRLAARITDSLGFTRVTPEVSVTLERAHRVELCKPYAVPERFGSRTGERMECRIAGPESLEGATEARLALSTWSGAHADEIGLNGRKLVDRVGVVHNYSHDLIPVPLEYLQTGENVFHILSQTEEHAAEVNWPGPGLLIRY